MTYFREIAIAVLLIALCLATYQCDRNKGKLSGIDAGNKRMENISSVQSGRKDVQGREQNLYPAVNQALGEVAKKRAEVRQSESKLPSVPTRKEIVNEVKNTTKGDINRLVDLFRTDGYGCSVMER